MKNKNRVCRLCVVLLIAMAGFFALSANRSEARRLLDKPKSLAVGKIYRYDIDGDGRKEKIRLESEENADSYKVNTKIYVDGKEYGEVKEKGSYSHHVILFDLYAKKKGMNLLVYGTADSDCLGKVRIYKLGQKKMTRIAHMKKEKKFGNLAFCRMRENIRQDEEDGTFYIFPDTPFYLNYFGCYYTKLKCRVTNGKIVCETKKNYSYNQEYTFTLQVSMNLYEKADLDSNVCELQKGTKLTVNKIQPVRLTKKEKAYSFVRVTTASGKTGWIYDQPIVDYDNYTDVFKKIPLWA